MIEECSMAYGITYPADILIAEDSEFPHPFD